MIEFWLKNEEENVEMLLPVPLPEYEYEHGNNIETVTTTNFGDINLSGHKKLSGMILSGFFPKDDYEFAKKEMEPMEYVAHIQKWIDDNAVIRLIIVDGNVTKVNSYFLIESIAHSETSETNGDINYKISLKGYRKIEVTKIVETITVVGNSMREDVKKTPKSNTYTVVSGDSLSRIARKMYGDASRWNLIYEANKSIIKNQNVIHVGQVFIIPNVPKSNSVRTKKPSIVNRNLLIENTVN